MDDEDCYNDWDGIIDGKTLLTEYKLIGFLGFTHEIKDNKLVEIKNEMFEKNSIVQYLSEPHIILEKYDYSSDDGSIYHLLSEDGRYRQTSETAWLKKIGILGVTHEFVNERLAR